MRTSFLTLLSMCRVLRQDGVLAVCCIRKQLGNVSAFVLEGERAKAARMALGQVRHRTLPFRKAANALAPNSTEKALDVHRPFVLGG